MSVDIDTSEVDALAADLAVAGAKAAAESSASLTEIAAQLRDWSVASAPVDTGELAGSIYVRGGAGFRIVGSDTVQGFFQEFGTSVMPPQPWLYGNANRAGDRLRARLEQIPDPV